MTVEVKSDHLEKQQLIFKMNIKSSLRAQIYIALLIGLCITLLLLMDWSEKLRPPNLEIKCNDPTIQKPIMSMNWMVFGDFLLFVFGFFAGSRIILLLQISQQKRQTSAAECWLVFMRPNLIFFIGFCATVVWVEIMSKYLGIKAPNFIAACQPYNLCNLCANMSRASVIVTCSKSQSTWIPAASAFPSVISTVQAFDMCFLTLFVVYRLKNAAKRWITYVVLLIASISTLATGGLTIYLNKADLFGVCVGCLIGILCSALTMSVLAWLEREKKPELPRFWNDPPPNDCSKKTVPSQALPSDAPIPPPSFRDEKSAVPIRWIKNFGCLIAWISPYLTIMLYFYYLSIGLITFICVAYGMIMYNITTTCLLFPLTPIDCEKKVPIHRSNPRDTALLPPSNPLVRDTNNAPPTEYSRIIYPTLPPTDWM